MKRDESTPSDGLPKWDDLTTDEARMRKIKHHLDAYPGPSFPVASSWARWMVEKIEHLQTQLDDM